MKCDVGMMIDVMYIAEKRTSVYLTCFAVLVHLGYYFSGL